MKRARQSLRLKGYDYTQAGLYFLTICVNHRQCLFGTMDKNIMVFNDSARMIQKCYFELENRFENIQCHQMVIMPNHFHSIIEIVGVPLVGTQNGIENNESKQVCQNNIGQPQGIAPTMGDIVGAFKSITTNEYIYGVKNYNWQQFNKKLWQRNYYEHIIRNEKSYINIIKYIENNPITWNDDRLNPDKIKNKIDNA